MHTEQGKMHEARVGMNVTAHQEKEKNEKPASSLVVSLGKSLNGTPHLYVGDR